MKRARRAVASAAVGSLLFAGLGTVAAVSVPAPQGGVLTSDPGYEWSSVEIIGGGYVPGIIFNTEHPDVVYARTDIGGAYRLDKDTQRWEQMLAHIGWDKWGYTGVVSLATDPVEPENVYAAVGTYLTDWDPNNGAILRSSDYGETWETFELPFKVGGNMPGRGMGERLMVDPNNNNVIYFGAEGGFETSDPANDPGLWRSTDKGVTWAKVESFTAQSNFVDVPGSEWDVDRYRQGVTQVVFDPTSAPAGETSQTIFVGVANTDSPLWTSTDGGSTWAPVPDAAAIAGGQGLIPHDILLGEDGNLFVAYSSKAGPYAGDAGVVRRLDTATGVWTDVTPAIEGRTVGENHFGFSGLTLDRTNPGTVMVVTQISWWPDINIFRSEDNGDTWTSIWGWEDEEFFARYTQDISGSPWLAFGSSPSAPNGAGEPSPKLGWMTSAFEIDPHNPDRFFYGTGATIYGGTNLTDWGTEPVHIEVKAHGIEETAIQDLLVPNKGDVELYSAQYDVSGYAHKDVTQVSEMFNNPYFGSATGLDAAGLDNDVVVRVGHGVGGGIASHSALSRDGGETWIPGKDPAAAAGQDIEGGNVAISADGNAIVWSPGGIGVHYSHDDGQTWFPVTTLPQWATVEADRVDASVFYAFAEGVFYISEDAGATFTPSDATGLPTDGPVRFQAVADRVGHIWFAGGAEDADDPAATVYGLWRSVDGGKTFTKLGDVDEADSVGFGAAAPGGTYPAIYTAARVDGVRGIFRSTDEGANWIRVNDDANQWAWNGNTITGDPNFFGRVYVGTNGFGIRVGDSSPELFGNLTVGETLHATVGSQAGRDAVGTFQWFADGVEIADATASSLTLDGDLEGSIISVAVSHDGDTQLLQATEAVGAATFQHGYVQIGAVEYTLEVTGSNPGDEISWAFQDSWWGPGDNIIELEDGDGTYTVNYNNWSTGFKNLGYLNFETEDPEWAAENTDIQVRVASLKLGAHTFNIGADLDINNNELPNIWGGFADGQTVFATTGAELRMNTANEEIGLYVLGTEVTPPRPIFRDDHIIIPDAPGVEYRIDGDVVNARVPLNSPVEVTANATYGYDLATDAITSWIFEPTGEAIEVVPPAPEVNSNRIFVPEVAGVEYQVAGEKISGVYAITEDITVRAVATEGYRIPLSAVARWDFARHEPGEDVVPIHSLEYNLKVNSAEDGTVFTFGIADINWGGGQKSFTYQDGTEEYSVTYFGVGNGLYNPGFVEANAADYSVTVTSVKVNGEFVLEVNQELTEDDNGLINVWHGELSLGDRVYSNGVTALLLAPDNDNPGVFLFEITRNSVVPSAPNFSDNTIVIPDGAGVDYLVNGQKVSGSVNITADTTVEARGAGLDLIADDAVISWTFNYTKPAPAPEPAGKFAQIVPTPDMSGDGIADMLAVDHDGVLWLYRGKANGGLSVATKVGSGWGNLTISAPGDFNGDGNADILAKAPNGDLFFYASNGKGGFTKAELAGWGWGHLNIIPAGDVTGDGVPDVLAIDEAGVLYYYAGNGKGGFTGKLTRNGQGWTGVDLYPAGDLNGDGYADILSIRKDGTLHTHLGKGGGGFSKSTQTGQGWAGYELFAGSDANGDGLADLYSRDSQNRLWFYAGKPGGFRTAVQVGVGW